MHQIHTGHAPQYLAHSVQLIAESSRWSGLSSIDTVLTTSNVALERNLVNVASVMLVQLPGTPYLSVLSLPLTPIDFKILKKIRLFHLAFW